MTPAKKETLLDQFDRERREIVYPHMRREVAGNLVRHVSRIESECKVKFSALAPDEIDSVIRAEIEQAQARHCSLDWQVYEHDTPAELPRALERHGFEQDGQATLLIRDLADLPQADSLPRSLTLRNLTDSRELQDFQSVSETVWNRSFEDLVQFVAYFLREHPSFMSVLVGYQEAKPVCCARSLFHPQSQFSFLLGGATLPTHRNQGCYSALVLARALAAKKRNVPYLVVEAMPTSQPILEHLGFEILSRRFFFELPAPPSVPLADASIPDD